MIYFYLLLIVHTVFIVLNTLCPWQAIRFLSVLIVWALLLHQLLRFRDKPIEFWHLFIFLEWIFLSGKYVGFLKRCYTILILLSSWISDQTHNDSPFRATGSHGDILCLKANPWGFQKEFRPAVSWGSADAPQKWGFAPPWAVQSHPQGCVTPRTERQSHRFAPWLWFPVSRAHSPLPT